MDINKLSVGLDNLDYYSDGFRNLLEDHYSWLKTQSSTKTVPIDAYLAVRYEFDFYGLLQNQNVPTELHWIVMRLTGYTSPDQMTRDLQSYVLPDPSVISRLYSTYSAKTGVS
ncbi:hypothetical protein [Burkholderia phage FLC9]|nr:hypothetical protein [Burkholderia phage FLC9]